MSLYHKSLFLKPQRYLYPQFRDANPEKQLHMFWSLFIFRGHSTREPASVVCNEEHAGWPILFCGPTQEPVLATANTGKTRKRFWKKCRWMDRKGRNKQGRNPWQKTSQVWLYTDLFQALKGERLRSVFSPDGTLISASAAPHCWGW